MNLKILKNPLVPIWKSKGVNMGVGWLKGILEKKAGVIDCSYTGTNQLKVILSETVFGIQKEYDVYMPEIEEYIVDQDVVRKAKDLGANMVVCDNWCADVTYAARKYAESVGLKIYKAGQFLAIIDSGKAP